jgi:predicted permease
MPPTPGQQIFFNLGYSLADVAAIRARRETFPQIASYTAGMATLTGASAPGVSLASSIEGEPRKLHVTLTGPQYFEALGVRPVLGRFFTASEDSTFAETPIVVLSHRFWQTTFGGARNVLGTTVRLGGRPLTIVGVAPQGFGGVEIEPADLFLPLGMAPTVGYQRDFIQKPSMKWLHIAARLAPGADDRQAAVIATTVLRGVDAADSAPVLGFDAKRGREVRPAPLNAYFGADAMNTSPVPLWMLGATAAVLLVVCANVANLLVARAERRRREIATRMALGANSGRIVRQLLAEGLVLAGLGGALGVAIAMAGSRLILLLPEMPALERVVDARAALFALAATLITTIGFALAPAFQAARSDAGELLRAGVRGTARATPVRTALLAVQFAASLALLGVGALFVRSLQNVQAIDVGFDVRHSLVVSADWDAFAVSSKEAHALLQQVAERARALPAVSGAALVSLAPFSGVSMSTMHVPGRSDLSAISGVPGGMFFTNAVDSSYFRTLGIAVRGRAFDGRDHQYGVGTVIVSETFAKRVWPAEDALGKCVQMELGPTAPCATVIGVAKDVRFMSLTSKLAPIFYSPFARQTDGPTQLIVQLRPGTSAAAARQTIAAIRTTLTSLDARVAFAAVRPLGEATFRSVLAPYRVSAAAFTIFGGLALVLAAVGLYGVVAYAVTQRTGEFGLRVALGARARDVSALVVRQGLRLIAVGAGVGAIAAVGIGRLLRSRLYGVDAIDVPALGAVAAVLALVALVACWIPARRAARADPSVALRNE